MKENLCSVEKTIKIWKVYVNNIVQYNISQNQLERRKDLNLRWGV